MFDASAYPPGYPHTAYFDEGTATASGTTIHTFTVTDPEGQPFSMSYSYSPFGSEEMFTITGKKYGLSQGISMRRFFRTSKTYVITGGYENFHTQFTLIFVTLDLCYKHAMYSKTCVKRPLKNRQNKDAIDKW